MNELNEYKKGISLCALTHQMSVFPFGDKGLIEFLEHCSPKVDEINLVDTSHNGNLREKLTKLAGNVRIFRTPYNLKDFDFSKNRNFSLSRARYSWILVLDPDERIRDWEMVRTVADTDEDIAYLLIGKYIKWRNPSEIESIFRGEVTGMARLFKNDKGYHFRRSIYEELHKKGMNQIIRGETLFCDYEHHGTYF